ncbi:MAG: DUF4127 family protein [Cyanobacteria bacterium REEB67]|nr:DUF4127 family protein [Cyanobacteria bacterium REEB67]
MKILLIPLDDRPVTFTFPALVARAARVEAILPPRHLMGSLTRPAQIDELLAFAETTIARQEPAAVIVCLDSLLYGGLITGRRSQDDFKTIMSRLDRVKKWKTLSSRPPVVMAQSSIMRISDNYDNTEEKEYWSRFGREIFEWSACLHRLARGEKPTAGLLESLERRIPADIRQDYLDTRRRNFSTNMTLLKSMNEGYIDHLIFSQDDSGAYGLNVSEKERLISTSAQLGLTDKVSVYAGADEVMQTLLARLLIAEGLRQGSGRTEAAAKRAPGVAVYFSPGGCSAAASRYEGQDIGTTVASHIDASALRYKPGDHFKSGDATTSGDGHPSENNDASQNRPLSANTFTLIIHGPNDRQGDHITLPGLADLSQIDTTEAVSETLFLIEKSTGAGVIIADVAYANGGDPKLIEALLMRPDLLRKVKSYSGWNTAGNTMGSALAIAVAYWFRESGAAAASAASSAGGPGASAAGKGEAKEAEKSLDWHKQCLFVRLVDDWAYQACVRKLLQGEPSTQKLAELIGPYIAKVNAALGMEPSVRLSFPWKRTFEIEISFEGT